MAVGTPTERLIFQALQPVRPWLDQEAVTEVLINGRDEVFYESGGRLQRADARFADSRDLDVLSNLLAQNSGRILGKLDFELDTSVAGPPALRIHANFGSTSTRGPIFTLRKLARGSVTLKDLVEVHRSLSPEACKFLLKAINTRRNIFICGGTGAGKTTVLKCLGEMIPPDERIVLIEDTAELAFDQPNVVSLLARKPDAYGEGEVTIRDLFRSSLRLRPDRIIIGEVRGPEAFDLVQALGSGHAGSLCTVHADSPLLAMARLHALAMMSNVPVPSALLQRQIAEVIHFVVQVQRLPSGQRVVSEIAKPSLGDDGSWSATPIFMRAPRPDGTPGELSQVHDRDS